MSFDLSARLAERRAAHLYRQRPLLEAPQQPDVMVDGDRLLAFCSNDYLGLANHSEATARRITTSRKPLPNSPADHGRCCFPPVIWRIWLR